MSRFLKLASMLLLLCLLAGCSSKPKWYCCIHGVSSNRILYLDEETIIESSLGRWDTYDISITNLSSRPQVLEFGQRQFWLAFENGYASPSTPVPESAYDFSWEEPIAPRSTVRAEVYFDVPDFPCPPIGVRFVMMDGEIIEPDMNE